MQVKVLNIQGQETGRTVELPEEIFGLEPNDHAIWLAVKQYLGAQRQGTHKVKTRAEVQGASRKLHKQKGTGGSRKGNIRNPLYKGGGTIFGPNTVPPPLYSGLRMLPLREPPVPFCL
jgi:large subunit ribosomal protein L4